MPREQQLLKFHINHLLYRSLDFLIQALISRQIVKENKISINQHLSLSADKPRQINF